MLIRPFLSLVLLLSMGAISLFAADWHPVDPADLALKQSKTDPNADAEGLFREVRIANEQHGVNYANNTVSEYVRIKIFTERGKEFANVQIPYFLHSNIFNVEGRTIQPDGSIVELSKDSIFNKVLEKRGFKTKVVSFALPAVQPGSIIEYKFSKGEGETTLRYRSLEVQSSFPVDQLTFFIKPLSNAYFSYPAMRYMPFGCAPERGRATRDGFDVLTVKNVPAFHEEPYSLPEYSAKQWILVYYEENSKANEKYWTALGKDRYKDYSQQIKVNGELKQLADQITTGAKTDDEKLAKLLNYCRTEIKDIQGDEITTAELDKAKANHNSVDTIHRKEGSRQDIQFAFLALAEAAGYDARRADLSDRSTFLFGPAMQSAYFLNSYDIAVNVGGQWKFFDVTNPALPPGQLRWQEQGVYALVTDSKEPEMVRTPLLTAQQSVKGRFATFTLSEEGVLEGDDVREILTGNLASSWREANRHTNDTQREEALREELKNRFADFDVTKVKFIANPDASKAVGINYHLLVRNYAQRTGKRLFVQPNYFAAGFGNRFPETARHNSVYFEYPWAETDSVDLNLPAGFVIDHGDAPPALDIPPTVKYSVKIGLDKTHNQLQYRRQFVFGDKDLLIFEANVYPRLKKVFDLMHDYDNHMLTLKAEAAPGSSPSGAVQ